MKSDDENKEKIPYRDILRFAAHYWRPNKWVGIVAVIAMIMAVVANSMVPVFSGRLIDAMVEGRPAAAAWAAFAGFVVLMFLHNALRLGSIFCWNFFAVRNLYAVVTDGMYKVQRFSADWHANAFAGATVRKITRGMWAFDQFEDLLVLSLLPALVVMVSATTVLSLRVPMVGVATFCMIILYCAASIWATVRILAPKFKDSAAQDTKMGATLADTITGNPTVKSFAAEKREDSVFRDVAQKWKDKSLHAWQASQLIESVRSVFLIAMTAGAVALTIGLWQAGHATPGDIVMVMTSFFVINGYLRDIAMHIGHLQRAVSDMEDVVSFWLRKDDVVDADHAAPLVMTDDARPDRIVFDRVGFGYKKGSHPLYTDLSLTIAAGEKIALVGPSGSGKSTFIKLLQRLYDVNSGRILIDGQDISKVTLESLRQSISLVPQDPVLFHRSLADNIAYGRPGVSMDEIIDAAKKSFAHDFIMDLPEGYDTLVGERGVKLSGGERQRVAIARALLTNAPVLILDEATSSLDSISEHYIQEALKVLMEGRTTITIAHRLSTIQQADRIVVFEAGRIVEQGTHKNLLADPASRYKKLFEMQVLGFTGQG